MVRILQDINGHRIWRNSIDQHSQKFSALNDYTYKFSSSKLRFYLKRINETTTKRINFKYIC